jgi:hypothetical protein
MGDTYIQYVLSDHIFNKVLSVRHCRADFSCFHDILYHTSFFVLLNNACHRLFRMGESDYLYDNLIRKTSSLKRF